LATERIESNATGKMVLALAVVWAVYAGAVPPAHAQTSGEATLSESGQTITIQLGGSLALHAPDLVKRVAVADPTIADVQMLDPTEVLVVAKGIGSTDLFIWSQTGTVWKRRVVVEADVERLNAELARLFPGTDVTVTGIQGTYFVSGTFGDADQVAQVHKYFQATGLPYVDMTRLAGVQQVQIQVRVAEANRVAVKKLGINALYGEDSFFGAALIGSERGGALNPVNMGAPRGASAVGNIPFIFTQDTNVSPLVTLLAGFPESDLEFFIQALAENQFLRILAEPNLVALSGEDATFLAGGEFPIPIVQGSTAAGGTSITIQYKEFGVRLKMRPTVLGNGGIRLYVAPEVSDLSDVGAVEIQGFSIPSLLTRRSETTVELKSGQTFAMAGLLNHSVNARSSRVPLLGDVPVAGAAFRSTRYQDLETELIILVTAKLVEPLSGPEQGPVPGDLHTPPSDWELFLLGRLSSGARGSNPMVNDNACPDAAAFSRLQGPGAWATYR